MSERGVEEGPDLTDEAVGGLRGAVGHLHGLKPYLREGDSTWWSCYLLTCIDYKPT